MSSKGHEKAEGRKHLYLDLLETKDNRASRSKSLGIARTVAEEEVRRGQNRDRIQELRRLQPITHMSR